MRNSRLVLGLCLTLAVVFAMMAWAAASVGDLHDRLSKVSPALATGTVVVAIGVAAAFGVASVRLIWKLGHVPERPVKAPEDVVKAATIQVEKAQQVIEKVADPVAKERLATELETIRSDQKARRFHVVVFGTGSAGKTSLINALLGLSLIHI